MIVLNDILDTRDKSYRSIGAVSKKEFSYYDGRADLSRFTPFSGIRAVTAQAFLSRRTNIAGMLGLKDFPGAKPGIKPSTVTTVPPEEKNRKQPDVKR